MIEKTDYVAHSVLLIEIA